MTLKTTPSGPNPGGKTFDRLLLLVGLVTVATAVMAAVAAFGAGGQTNGEGSGHDDHGTTTTTVADGPQTVTYTLNEFAISGPTEIEAGATVFEVVNEGAIAHNLSDDTY